MILVVENINSTHKWMDNLLQLNIKHKNMLLAQYISITHHRSKLNLFHSAYGQLGYVTSVAFSRQTQSTRDSFMSLDFEIYVCRRANLICVYCV